VIGFTPGVDAGGFPGGRFFFEESPCKNTTAPTPSKTNVAITPAMIGFLLTGGGKRAAAGRGVLSVLTGTWIEERGGLASPEIIVSAASPRETEDGVGAGTDEADGGATEEADAEGTAEADGATGAGAGGVDDALATEGGPANLAAPLPPADPPAKP
jgi:hypothetical protein